MSTLNEFDKNMLRLAIRDLIITGGDRGIFYDAIPSVMRVIFKKDSSKWGIAIHACHELLSRLGGGDSHGVFHPDMKSAILWIIDNPNGTFENYKSSYNPNSVESDVGESFGSTEANFLIAVAAFGNLPMLQSMPAMGSILEVSKENLFNLSYAMTLVCILGNAEYVQFMMNVFLKMSQAIKQDENAEESERAQAEFTAMALTLAAGSGNLKVLQALYPMSAQYQFAIISAFSEAHNSCNIECFQFLYQQQTPAQLAQVKEEGFAFDDPNMSEDLMHRAMEMYGIPEVDILNFLSQVVELTRMPSIQFSSPKDNEAQSSEPTSEIRSSPSLKA